jgi:hypothetical protein
MEQVDCGPFCEEQCKGSGVDAVAEYEEGFGHVRR